MRLRNLLWLVPTAAVLLLVLPSGGARTTRELSEPERNHRRPRCGVYHDQQPPPQCRTGHVIGPGGALIPVGQFSTHGKGTGGSLADQNAITLTNDHHWLLVINAGSNSISVFRVNSLSRNGPILAFVDQVWSHGPVPVSIAVHGSFVYVLNAGSTTVVGTYSVSSSPTRVFSFHCLGQVRALSTSTSTEPAEIAFNPAGNALVVTEKATSSIDTYSVGHQGYVPGPPSLPRMARRLTGSPSTEGRVARRQATPPGRPLVLLDRQQLRHPDGEERSRSGRPGSSLLGCNHRWGSDRVHEQRG